MPEISDPRERPAPSANAGTHDRAAYRPWLMSVGALTLAFIWPLVRLAQLAAGHAEYSHILIVPAVSAFLLWRIRSQPFTRRRDAATGVAAAVVALALLLGYARLARDGTALATADALALTTGAYVAGVVAVTAWVMGRAFLRHAAFPLAFLVFMVPIPDRLVVPLESFLQYGSAAVAYALLSLVGTPVLREGLLFHVPGISIEIAPECSGIRATLALFITSLVAGYVLLRSNRNRVLLAALVVPIALLRNGFRVFTIAEMCVHLGPQEIDSPIHHKGGPLFFVLFLIPFLVILRWMMNTEKEKSEPAPPPASEP